MDFVAWGVRGFSRPICGDATIVSPLHRDGTPHPLTPDIDGASFLRAVAHKEATYPELARRNQYGELTVLACETGGRWHHRALSMVSSRFSSSLILLTLVLSHLCYKELAPHLR